MLLTDEDRDAIKRALSAAVETLTLDRETDSAYLRVLPVGRRMLHVRISVSEKEDNYPT